MTEADPLVAAASSAASVAGSGLRTAKVETAEAAVKAAEEGDDVAGVDGHFDVHRESGVGGGHGVGAGILLYRLWRCGWVGVLIGEAV